MKKYIFIVLLLLISISNIISQTQTDVEWPTLAKSDWPMIKHDPQFTGRSSYKGPQTATIIWTVDMEDGIFSGPVIGEEGNLYFGSYYQLDSADHFYSYSAKGNLIWDYKLGSNRPPQSGILIDSSNTIYFGSLDGYFYALNSDGTLKWKYLTSNPIVELAIPNIDKLGRLYITNGQGELYSINPDGTLNWNVKYEEGFYKKSPVFSPDGNTIYIAGKDSNLYALNLDGSLKWKFSVVENDKAPLVDSNGNIYFDSGYNLYCLFPNGTIRWIFNDYVMGSYSMPSIDKNGNIYAIGFELTLQGVEKLLVSINYNGSLNWIYAFDYIDLDDYWQPLICDSEGTVYVGSTFGNYYYAISSAGELKWKLPLNDYQVDNTGAISKDGILYIGVHKSSLTTNQQKTLIAIKDTGAVSVELNNFKILDYYLDQNYPNPFNPATKISYSIKDEGLVSLKVYDVLGKEIATLVNDYKSAGNYEVEFNASQLSSGMYIYKIQAGNFSDARKMLLTK
ncbi:MAG: PQQ-binding-like beta-propeller repeat protein [Ignavibacteriaceae bacterium]